MGKALWDRQLAEGLWEGRGFAPRWQLFSTCSLAGFFLSQEPLVGREGATTVRLYSRQYRYFTLSFGEIPSFDVQG